MVGRFIELACKISSTLVVFAQGLLLNAFLHKLYCPVWWSWVVADVAVVIVWSSLVWFAKVCSLLNLHYRNSVFSLFFQNK